MAKKKRLAAKNPPVLQEEVNKIDIFVSVVVVLRPDLVDRVDAIAYIRNLSDMLSRHYSNYEVIIVDNSFPAEIILPVVELLTELPCLRIIKLSRRFPHDTAIIAGLEGSIGDSTIITDPALDPIEAIPRMVTENRRTDIVQGTAKLSKGRRSIHITTPRRLFYRYCRKYMMIDVPPNATYFIALSRRAIAAVTSNVHKSTHIRFEIRTIGYTYQTLPYEVNASPLRRRSLRVGIFEAADIISSYSVHPLRFMAWVGLMASVISMIYALYVIWVAITNAHVAEGWTTMSLQISGLFFILFLILIVLSEYIGKLLVESRHQPKYHVIDELTSTIALANAHRKNVSEE